MREEMKKIQKFSRKFGCSKKINQEEGGKVKSHL